MSYSIDVDWSEDFEDWENNGRQILDDNCNHKTQDKDSSKENRETNLRYSGHCEECYVSEDACQPMMNYAYPLEITPTDEAVLKVVKNTCLTIMYKVDEGKYYLALCGGGMDLSQQIGLAYIFCEKWIPEELYRNISTQKDLSVSGEDWKTLRYEMIEQGKNYVDRFTEKVKSWEEAKE
jgi:hypothetical protein